ncbi:MAG: UDP-N-acetylmuramoyl-L-alanyl-D-glutamate--2,6-diaminopimelate ligase [Syntrophomonadaceae bacterium]|nr:UDP-N-acetylmuramoyl-L-alanyl-D-glutamate--2,6-diaminopimelate ligase [Syntrophomonadaceae bacterium]
MALLAQLLTGLDIIEVKGNPELEILGIQYDSRQVAPGFLFVAIPGFKTDGHQYIPAAVTQGAVALVVEKPVVTTPEMVVIQVPDARQALARLAAAFCGFPSTQLRVIGVTGTNGKTTTTYLLEAIFQRAGYQVGLLGTIGNRIAKKMLPVAHTTPESLDLQILLKQMVDVNSDYAVMEVSSHALALNRVEGCEFDVAVFTNLSQDHLDFHCSMEEYQEAKLRLFERLGSGQKTGPRYAVVNIDDAAGGQFIQATKAEVVTFGIDQPAQVQARNLKITSRGTTFQAVLPEAEIQIDLAFTGRFSVYNALAALAVGWKEGIKLSDIQAALAAVRGVPGRFERVDCRQDFTVIVDYAHTPDGLKNVLSTAREVTRGRIITVFGCGGDRDRTKRPLMGEAVARLSDYTVVTSDNPRTEDPVKIVEDILPGMWMADKESFTVILDRRQAIQHALQVAQPEDIVIIAGKGHENCQLIGDKALPFNDREVARELLSELAE